MQPSWLLYGDGASRYESSLQQQGSSGRSPLPRPVVPACATGSTRQRARKMCSAQTNSYGLVTVYECLSTELAAMPVSVSSLQVPAFIPQMGMSPIPRTGTLPSGWITLMPACPAFLSIRSIQGPPALACQRALPMLNLPGSACYHAR